VKYAICFDYPEADDPYFAGEFKGGLGWAPTLATALLFDDEETAERTLENGYTPANQVYATVVEVEA
jgi:hypothetical protein